MGNDFPPVPVPEQIDEREITTKPFANSAIYVDRFVINCHAGMVRIMVAENTAIANEMQPRGCIIMTNVNAQNLISTIQNLLNQQHEAAAGMAVATGAVN